MHWNHGGRTDLENLISLCPYHHKLVHDRGHLIALHPAGTVTFYRPDGTALPNSPPRPALPPPDAGGARRHERYHRRGKTHVARLLATLDSRPGS